MSACEPWDFLDLADFHRQRPHDGGPGLCTCAHDFDRDRLDEIMTWDPDHIRNYHPDAEVDPARL